MKCNLNIKSIEILPQDTFDGIMIRTCIFDASKEPQDGEIKLKRLWNEKIYESTTFYNEYNEIPLFIGEISKQIYHKVMSNQHKLTAYKGWNGVDSYAKFCSKDPDEYEYPYLEGVKKKSLIIFSSKYADKVKAKINKKRNNVGTYDRFHLRKIFINEIMFNSFEVKNHIKYLVKDEEGQFGCSSKHTAIVFDDENIDSYIEDLRSPISQMMLSIIKDYNHNDSKLFRYIPYGISKIELTDEEKEFISMFEETPIENVFVLSRS